MKRSPSLRHRSPVLVESLELRRLLAASAVEFDAASYSVNQADGVVTFLLTRTGDDSTAETVAVATSDGTAVAGVDYQQEQVTIIFAPGVSSQGGVVELDQPGASATPTKSFALNLSDSTGGLTLGTPSTATVTIHEPAAVTPTTTTVTAGTNGGGIAVMGPVNLGAPVTFTAQVARTGLGIGTPTGTITFSVDGVAQSPTPLASNDGVSAAFAEFTTSSLALGQHTISAVYSGDASATTSQGATTVTVARATTAILQQSAQTSAVGQPVTFTDYVQATDPAAGTPTGTVTFDLYGAAALPGETIAEVGKATLVATATPGLAMATYTASDLAVGLHDIIANYAGDATYAPQSSHNIEGIGYATTTAIGSSANPAVTGQPVTLTAVVTASSVFAPLVGYNSQADGYVPATVVFTIDGVPQVPVALQASQTSSLQGTAQLTTGPLAAGAHVVTAAFSDGSNHYNAQSQATLTVPATTPLQPTEVALATVGTPAAGQPYVLVATASGPVASLGIPTGQVELLDGTTVVGTLTLDPQGQAVFFLPSLAAGTHSFRVVYGGDANFAASTATEPTFTAAATPTVTGVARAGVGAANQATAAVVLSFSTTLDPTAAQVAANYRVTTATGRRIAVRTATYNVAARTVTLHLASRLAPRATYTINVAAGTGATAYQGTIAAEVVAHPLARVQTPATTTHPRGPSALAHSARATG